MLGDPEVVKAVEESFVPLCIYNNARGGHDVEVLKRFRESPWNNPVVRVIAPDTGKDLVEPVRSDWSRAALAEAMALALESAGKEIPEALSALRKKRD